MIVSRVVASKLWKAKIVFAVRSRDGRSALGCAWRDAINEHGLPAFRESGRQLIRQRRWESQTIVDASDGAVIMRSREGRITGCFKEPGPQPGGMAQGHRGHRHQHHAPSRARRSGAREAQYRIRPDRSSATTS